MASRRSKSRLSNRQFIRTVGRPIYITVQRIVNEPKKAPEPTRKNLPWLNGHLESFRGFLVNLIVSLITLIVIGVPIYIVSTELHRPQPVIITGFSIAPDVEKVTGLNSDLLTGMFRNSLIEVVKAYKSSVDHVDLDREHSVITIPEIEVPSGPKIALAPLIQWYRGNPATVKGEVTIDDDNLYVSLRYAPSEHENIDEFVTSDTLQRAKNGVEPSGEPKKNSKPHAPSSDTKIPMGDVKKLMSQCAESFALHRHPYAVAVYFEGKGQYEECQEALSQYLQTKDCNRAWAYNLRSIMYCDQGQYQRALLDVQSALDVLKAKGEKGTKLFYEVKYDEARTNYLYGKRLRALDQEEAAMKKFNVANVAVQMALQDEEDAEYHFLAALNYGQLSATSTCPQTYWEEAKTHYKRSLELAPEQVPVITNYGHMLIQAHQGKNAFALFEKAMAIQPIPSALTGLGMATLFNTRNPKRFEVASNYYYEAKKMYQKSARAESRYAQLLLIQAPNPPANSFGGDRITDALRHYHRSMELDKHAETKAKLDAWFARHMLLKQYNRFRSAVRHKPRDVKFLSYLGDCAFYLSRFDEAALWYATAFKLNPNAPEVWRGRALLAWHNKQYQEAIQYLAQVTKMAPSWTLPVVELGDVMVEQAKNVARSNKAAPNNESGVRFSTGEEMYKKAATLAQDRFFQLEAKRKYQPSA